MRKLGLIGGTGPESTIPYYHDIVYGVQEKAGKPFFPHLVIESLSVFEILDMCAAHDYEGLVEYLVKGIQNLEAAGADFAALSANTPHIVFDELVKRVNLPLVSIVEAACEETKRRGYKRIGLIGTAVTMDNDFFKKPFREAGIEVILPNSKERQYIAEKIPEELELGIVKEETQNRFLAITERLAAEDGIEAVVLGCTELPLVYKNTSVSVDILDTMDIHIKKLVNMIMASE